MAKRFSNAEYPIRFQIIGEGDYERQLKKLCNELGVQNMVSFLGFKDNPYPYLKNRMYMSVHPCQKAFL